MDTVEALFVATPPVIPRAVSLMRAAERRLEGRRAKKLLKEAIAELLRENPDLVSVQGWIQVVETIVASAPPALARARAMLRRADAMARTRGSERHAGSRVPKVKATKKTVKGGKPVKRKTRKKPGTTRRKS